MSHAIVTRVLTRLSQIPAQRLGDEEIIVHKAELAAMDPKQVEFEILPACVQTIQAHLLHYGWPMPPARQSIAEALWEVQQSAEAHSMEDNYSSWHRAGVDYLRSRFPSFWHAGQGPAIRIHNYKTLTTVVKYRLGLNKKNEAFNLSLKAVRRGFISGRYTVSLFKPVVAARIYKRWMPVNSTAEVWDPSGGFGSRMLGFLSVFPDGAYYANEPASMTHYDLTDFGLGLTAALPRAVVSIHKSGSEVAGPPNPVSLVFTSPPYFDLEKYFDEPAQCWRKYPSKPDWLDHYLEPTMKHAMDALLPNGRMVLNVSPALRDDALERAAAVGFELEEEERLVLPVGHFQRANGRSEPRTEPVLIWKKSKKSRAQAQGSERWAYVQDTNERYQVSTEGRVKSFTRSKRGSVILGHTVASGYRAVSLTLTPGGPASTRLLHRLVLETFRGPPSDSNRTDVCHLDGDKQNNALSNLVWGTRSENLQYAIRTRQDEAPSVGSQTSRSWHQGRTRDRELIEVCVDLVNEEKIGLVDVARILGCTEMVASNIIRGRTHKHLELKPAPAKVYRSKARKAQIRKLVRQGLSREEVNKQLGETLTAQAFYYYKTSS